MPDADKIRELIAARYPRSMQAWRERLDAALPASSPPVVVRLERQVEEGKYAALPVDTDLHRNAELDLRIKILRHLGNGEYVVALRDHDHQNHLALHGWLDAAEGKHRLIAI